MASISDIIALGQKIIADFEAGNYASLARDIGDGFTKLGDLLQSLFGLQSVPVVSDVPDVEGFQTACNEFLARNKSKKFAAGAQVAGFDPGKFLKLFETLMAAFTSIWDLFRPKP